MAHDHNCCNNYTRSQLLRAAAAKAGKGLPAIETGMPLPAGTGPLAPLVPARAAPGLALAVYGATQAAARRPSRRASPTPGAPTAACSSRSSSTAASTRSACWRRSTTRTYQRLRPTLRLGSERHRVHRGPEPRWHPSAPRLRTLHDEGKVTSFPAIGYTSPNQSHFTSRHFYEIGELEIGASTGWLGRYIDQTGDRRQPAAGPLPGRRRSRPTLATADQAGRGRRRRRPTTTCRPHGVGDAGRGADVQQLRHFGDPASDSAGA